MNTLRQREIVGQFEHSVEHLIDTFSIRERALEGLKLTVEERDYLRSLHLEVEMIG